LSALRGVLFLAFEVPTWEIWFVGAIVLLVCVAVIRRWAHYFITSGTVEVKNGFTGHDIDVMELQLIKDITISQGPLAGLMDIGTITIQGADPNHRIRFRGIQSPDVVKVRLEALRPALSDTVDVKETHV
jgi:membrane protein YdbS with pleckstrin-like domain